MKEQNARYREVLLLTVGELIATGLMLGVFALLGKWSVQVLLGGLAGLVLACLNYLLLAVSVDLAAKKAEQGDVAAGKGVMTKIDLGIVKYNFEIGSGVRV